MAPFSNTNGTLITLGAIGLLAAACVANKGLGSASISSWELGEFEGELEAEGIQSAQLDAAVLEVARAGASGDPWAINREGLSSQILYLMDEGGWTKNEVRSAAGAEEATPMFDTYEDQRTSQDELIAAEYQRLRGSRAAKTNYEGLTWDEWSRAASNWGRPAYPNGKAIGAKKLKAAWKAGEDPTEYAVHTVG